MKIELNRVTKNYYRSAWRYLVNSTTTRFRTGDYLALQDVSLRVQDGERVGIIGRNGAGKTTLLSIIGGYASPTSGTVCVEGRVTPVMEIGSSIDPELSGRQNIEAAGHLYRPNEDLSTLISRIIKFVDLGAYIDMPMKTYSSGMKARISFGCVLFIQPEILIVDEVLGVGDAEFSQKSTAKIKELCQKGKILLLVSHSMDTIREYTERCIWLDQGRCIMDGPSEEVTRKYEEKVEEERQKKLIEAFNSQVIKTSESSFLQIENFWVVDQASIPGKVETFKPFDVSFTLTAKRSCRFPLIELTCSDIQGRLFFADKIPEGLCGQLSQGEKKNICAQMQDVGLNAGYYRLSLSVFPDDGIPSEAHCTFEVINRHYYSTKTPLVFVENSLIVESVGQGEEKDHEI